MVELKKFSPEWYYEEAQKPENLAFSAEAKQLREEFVSQYGIEQLKQLQGRDLLIKLFPNNEESKNNLCYIIEFQPRYKSVFGSISGGSAYKFGLFYHKKNNCWTAGTPIHPIELTEEEAIELAGKIRDSLVEGAEIMQNSICNSREDYEALYEKVKHIFGIDTVWVLKYYQMLFPDLLPVFYSREIQLSVLKLLNIAPSDISFVRMGQITLYVRQCKIPSMTFGHISYPYLNNEKETDSANRVNTLADSNIRPVHYWIYSPGEGASRWDTFYRNGIMAIGWSEIGDLSSYSSREAMKQALKSSGDSSKSYKMQSLATWQFSNEMKIGDVIFAKRGRDTIIGRGVITSDYRFDDSYEDDYKNIREVNWTHNGVWEHPGMAAMKVLTDITQYTEYVSKLNDLFSIYGEDEENSHEIEYPQYSPEDFLSEVYMDKNDYSTLVSVLKTKKNIILQGAPGVGKTFVAKRLAYSIMGVKDQERVMMIQFHQSYSYEDFIMGFRPSTNGFELKKGAFYNFCKTAEADAENDYFFIIDEINRGNLSKIFGELFMLIETDKRGIELQLLYSDERFSVPANVYIIGLMNTADRSLAMLDYALRRRFAFFEIKPGFSTDGFRSYRMGLQSEKFNKLIATIESLNVVISSDDSLGDGFCIGHSYFCNLDLTTFTDQQLSAIVEYEIIPLLKEYWFDEPSKVKDWSSNLRSAIK